jgi:hypothetical protein
LILADTRGFDERGIFANKSGFVDTLDAEEVSMSLNLLHPKLIDWMSKRRQIRRIELMHRASGEKRMLFRPEADFLRVAAPGSTGC